MADENTQPEEIDNGVVELAREAQPQQVIIQQQTATSGLIEDFFSILKGSWILQVGFLFVFLAVGYNIIAGGKLIMFGITVVDSQLPEDLCNEYYTELYDSTYTDERYKLKGTLVK